MSNKIFKITTQRSQSYYVVAESPGLAYEALEDYLTKARSCGYGGCQLKTIEQIGLEALRADITKGRVFNLV
jgi:hypothetical protein